MDTLLGAIALGTFGWIYVMMMLFAGIFGVGVAVFWIWMLVEVLTRETDDANTRLVWSLVIVFTHAIGALIYLIVRRGERIKKLGK
jgi:hypothetical protein